VARVYRPQMAGGKAGGLDASIGKLGLPGSEVVFAVDNARR